jgi:molybdopterin molybdotransferase
MALMPVAEAFARVLAQACPLPPERVPLTEAHGRVLAADLEALRTQPPADVSAMDGYAVRSADVASVPVRLKVVGEVAAGHPFAGRIGAGEAARIFTGGVIPPGECNARRRRHRRADERGQRAARARRGARLRARRAAVAQRPATFRS